MKKVLFIAAFAVFGLSTLSAQTEKGNLVVGGGTSISFASTKTTLEFDGDDVSDNDLTTTLFSITPNIGYFVIDNLAVGVELGFSSTKFDNGISDGTSSSFSGLLAGTYYFEAGDNLKPFVGVGAGLISTSSGDEDDFKSSGLAIRGKGGLAYFLNDSIAIDFSVYYLNANQKNKANDKLVTKNSSFAVGLGFSLFF